MNENNEQDSADFALDLDAWVFQATIRMSAMEEIMLAKKIMTVDEMDSTCERIQSQFEANLKAECEK